MAHLSKLTDPQAVIRAIAEFEHLKRSRFLKKYGFGRSRDYFINYNGHYYDSKPITAAAYGLQHPTEGPLKNTDFSGGRNTVKIAIERLAISGLAVVPNPFQFLVLAENEVYAQASFTKWKDVTGERYHFPNQYINHIVPGREFIYYKGSRRKSGRAEPEYFGRGKIGAVYPDPESTNALGARKNWICDIEDYHQFSRPVSLRDNKGNYIELDEKTAPQNHWRVGVRVISDTTFQNILEAAGISKTPSLSRQPMSLNSIKVISEVVETSLLMPRKERKSEAGIRTKYPSRRSGRAKEIGDYAEAIVLRWLQEKINDEREREKIVHLAAQGETPGWDIVDRRKKLEIAYEVKGTSGAIFPNIQVTANEWKAAELMGARYNLVLVANCESETPRIEVVNNPWRLFAAGKLRAEATEFRIERTEI